MQPEDIDKLFRDRLQGHAPTPPAFLWDKLEAELQPARKKRPVMWLYASAAVLTLLLVAGGAWLLRTGGLTPAPADMATVVSRPSAPAVSQPQSANEAIEKEISTAQATATPASASSLSKAVATAAPAPAKQQTTTTTASAPRNTQRLAATENRAVAAATPRPAQPERTVKTEPVPTITPEPLPAALASTTTTPEPAAPLGPIEVEVRRQTQAPVALASNGPASRPLLGSLIRHARNVLRGDQVTLAEAGLPETVTVQARVAGHTLTKVIQL
ncbi:hypothetical protein PK28_10415 [Hymenobacter sp. DG25B]|jgi:hypothetical protein|uniref:hypothetical protein n=1 Tax=Hymenobacter sp. DG25B TaxID=1385664 RepID=UPI000540FCE9|nr:hypothetical protein [Hymenobacter sp. DG25B]AIZ63998.1 hypothetical protein PK28_10415 [Hymenobacter sp. DG25B]